MVIIEVFFSFTNCHYVSLQVSMEAESEYKVTYRSLLNKFANGVRLLEFALSAIDRQLQQAQEYIRVWLQFQSLWDLQPDSLYNR